MLSSRSLKVLVLGCAVLIAGCDRQGSDEAQQPAARTQPAGSSSGGEQPPAGTIDRSHRGSQLPDFTLTDTAGRTLKLADLKGRPLLINLWATWCAPCVAELPQLDALAARGNVRVLTVSQDAGQPEKVAQFLAARGVTRLEPWLDPQNDLSFHYATGTLPTTIYYDAQGREIWRYVGGHDWTSDETAAMLTETAAR